MYYFALHTETLEILAYYLSIRLNCYRHHNQLSKSCIPNLSSDQLNQSCLNKGKIAPRVFILPNEAKQALLE